VNKDDCYLAIVLLNPGPPRRSYATGWSRPGGGRCPPAAATFDKHEWSREPRVDTRRCLATLVMTFVTPGPRQQTERQTGTLPPPPSAPSSRPWRHTWPLPDVTS